VLADARQERPQDVADRLDLFKRRLDLDRPIEPEKPAVREKTPRLTPSS